jgi:hypothetical protein
MECVYSELAIGPLPGEVLANPMPRIDLCKALNLLNICVFEIPFSVKLDENDGIFVPRFRKKIPQTIAGARLPGRSPACPAQSLVISGIRQT